MTHTGCAGLFLGITVSLMLCGCQTPDPIIIEKPVEKRVEVPVEVPDTRIPLTEAILQRLSNSHEDLAVNINRFQLVLFGRISLEREYSEENDGLEKGGRVNFEDVHTSEVITIPDQIEGQALQYTEEAGEAILYLCFERNTDNTLLFSTRPDDPGEYFFLKVDVDNNVPPYGEERGTIMYGGLRYKVKYGGDKAPYLMIKLSKNDRDRLNSRTLEGRRVE